MAQELSHPFSLAFALHCAVWLSQFRREVKATQEQTEALIALSQEQGFTLRGALGVTWRGWALAMQGRGEEGIAQIRQGLAATQATGAEIWRPYFLTLLAEACGQTGQGEQGLAALAEALAFVDKTGLRGSEAELYRLKGELTLQSKTSLKQGSGKSKASHDKSKVSIPQSAFRLPPPSGGNPKLEEAEACFRKAIEIARKQQAKSLELRATVSLARLWQQQDKKAEAHGLLLKIYGWFTEGFDTKDLQEAKALLEELS